MKKVIFIILSLIAFPLFGCSEKTIQQFEGSLQRIEDAIISPSDWTTAEVEVISLKKSFDKNLWKMQLLGDENEYESLKKDLLQLEAAIHAQDKSQTIIFISSIKSEVTSIFKGNKIEQRKPKPKDKKA